MSEIENLAALLAQLPGIGKKSALRISYSLINKSEEYNSLLGKSISSIKEKVHKCPVCGSFTETDPCAVCSDPSRDRAVLCVVEQPQDVITIQSSGVYSGLFHVLGGAINPLAGVGPEDLGFDKLLKRIKEGSFTEIIIATNPTEEGDTTALYIRHLLRDYPEITLTRLASGLPIGGDLEYADIRTLTRSLRGRIKF
ncbi:MAG: recombination mediator RecR [Sphaerochaetaceae bacterium]|nr:recombination mediator RecR [Sphaerochaetaceae bacterium]